MSAKDQKIWQVVAAIPAGKVASYGQIADMAGLGRQARYIGKALGKLPEGHSIPWYRVIRSNGQIAFPIGSEALWILHPLSSPQTRRPKGRPEQVRG